MSGGILHTHILDTHRPFNQPQLVVFNPLTAKNNSSIIKESNICITGKGHE